MSFGSAMAGGFLLGALLTGLAAWALWRWHRRRLGRLLSFAGHELNTPLTAVNITVLNFLSGIFGEIPAEHQKWMGILRSQVARLIGVVGEMRDFVHLELRSDIALVPEKVSVQETVEAVLAAVSGSVASAEAPVEVALGDLPRVRADPDRLFRALLSLLYHARKFRSSGRILLRGEARAGGVEISVEYSGPDQSAEQTEAALDLYYPARQRGDQQLGAVGLGLGLLRTMTRRQGGDLAYRVDGAGGTRLVLSLPLAEGEALMDKPPRKFLK